jgi:hypothetical protein
MFKKLKNAKNIGDKALQAARVGIKDVKQKSQSDDIANVKSHINQAVNGAFANIKKESANQLKNDSAIIKAADLAYSTIPLPIRLVVRKKRFQQIMFKVRDKCLQDSNTQPDQCSMGIIDKAIE